MVVKHNTAYHKSFEKVFSSMQLSGGYVLWYDIDFSKEEIKNFSNFFEIHNNENISGNLKLLEITNDIIDKFEFDCKQEAVKFPVRAKLKMCGKQKQKDVMSSLNGATDAITTYLAITIYTLQKHYEFNENRIREWYEKLVDFCRLYGDGMQDWHVITYFERECDIHITVEE